LDNISTKFENHAAISSLVIVTSTIGHYNWVTSSQAIWHAQMTDRLMQCI